MLLKQMMMLDCEILKIDASHKVYFFIYIQNSISLKVTIKRMHKINGRSLFWGQVTIMNGNGQVRGFINALDGKHDEMIDAVIRINKNAAARGDTTTNLIYSDNLCICPGHSSKAILDAVPSLVNNGLPDYPAIGEDFDEASFDTALLVYTPRCERPYYIDRYDAVLAAFQDIDNELFHLEVKAVALDFEWDCYGIHRNKPAVMQIGIPSGNTFVFHLPSLIVRSPIRPLTLHPSIKSFLENEAIQKFGCSLFSADLPKLEQTWRVSVKSVYELGRFCRDRLHPQISIRSNASMVKLCALILKKRLIKESARKSEGWYTGPTPSQIAYAGKDASCIMDILTAASKLPLLSKVEKVPLAEAIPGSRVVILPTNGRKKTNMEIIATGRIV